MTHLWMCVMGEIDRVSSYVCGRYMLCRSVNTRKSTRTRVKFVWSVFVIPHYCNIAPFFADTALQMDKEKHEILVECVFFCFFLAFGSVFGFVNAIQIWTIIRRKNNTDYQKERFAFIRWICRVQSKVFILFFHYTSFTIVRVY